MPLGPLILIGAAVTALTLPDSAARPAPGLSSAPARPATAGRRYHGSARQLRVTLPFAEVPPRLDGRLDEPAWEQAAVLDSFTQTSPVEGLPDTLGTECWIMYDAENIYVAFRCKDDPREVRAPLVPRDEVDDGDFAAVAFDTYLDRQRSMQFGANPRGVQYDAINHDGADPDVAPDFQFTSRARITGDGYEIEMAVPFKSLRFPPGDPLAFGFAAARVVQRTGASYFWPPITSDVASEHAQYGTLEGMTGIHRGRNLEVAPYATGRKAAERADDGLEYDRARGRLGVDLQYGLTSNLILDTTLRPDFSQIEADAGVIDVNERFALYFDEKRPFFLEGSDVFRTPFQAVYTRRIVDPLYGAKLTGKSGRTTIGVLGATDLSPGEPIEGLSRSDNRYEDHDATATIVRVKRDVLGNSYLGALGEAREQLDAYSRNAGLDGRFQSGPWAAEFQSLWSWKRARDFSDLPGLVDSTTHAALDPEIRAERGAITSGVGWRAAAARSSRHLETKVYWEDFSRGFSADLGFIPRTGIANAGVEIEPRVLGGEGDWFAAIEPRIEYERTIERRTDRHFGRRLDETLEAEAGVVLPANVDFGAGGSRVFTWDRGREFPDQYRGWAWLDVQSFDAVRGEISSSFGDDVIFDQGVPGRSWNGTLELSVRIGPRLRADGELNSRILWRKDGGARFADMTIPRLELNWQFTRELAFRAIGELNSARGYDAAGGRTSDERETSLDLLASYLLRPGCVFYLGYGSELAGAALERQRPDSAQLFVKASWRWLL